MTNEEFNKIQSLMKKIFIVSFIIYALFVFCIFYFLGKLLTPTLLVTIVIFGPMVIGLLILLIIKLKNPPVIDDSEDESFENIISENSETED